MAVKALPWTSSIRFEGGERTRVMLVSGFGSSPETLRDLAAGLHAGLGATVLVEALAGHAGDTRAFLQSRSWDYVEAAERRFLAFCAEGGGPVYLGGYSTGALVALLVAARHPADVSGLALVSPAFRLAQARKQALGYSVESLYYGLLPAGLLVSLLPVAWQIRRHGWRRHPRLLRALASGAVFAAAALGLRSVTVPLDPGEPVARDGELVRLPHYARASLLSGSSLAPLQLAARRRLRSLACPVCFVFGEDDGTVDVAYGVDLASKAPRAEAHVVPGAGHRVITHPECLRIVAAFVRRSPRLDAETRRA